MVVQISILVYKTTQTLKSRFWGGSRNALSSLLACEVARWAMVEEEKSDSEEDDDDADGDGIPDNNRGIATWQM